MAKFLILSDFPDNGDSKKAFSDNQGGYFWHLLYKNKAPIDDIAIEFLYEDFTAMKYGNNRWMDIEAKHKPEVVLSVGAASLKMFPTIDGKLQKVRGSVYDIPRKSRKMYVIPTYHPRDLKKKEKMYGDESIEKSFCASIDIYKAVGVYNNGWTVPEERFNLEPTCNEVEEFVENAISNRWLLGGDIEGTGLNLEFSEIVVLGFAWSESDAICIPFRTTGGSNYYSKEDWIRVTKAVKRLLREGRFMFQNGVGYDIPLLRNRGWDFPLENLEMDTMVQHHTLNPEMPHNIGFISSQYGKQPFWKDVMSDFWGEKIFQADQIAMRTYNCRDCTALWQVYNGMNEHMDELIKDDPNNFEGLPNILKESMKQTRAVMVMQEQGMLLDKSKLAIWRKWIDEHLNEIELKLNKLVTLPKVFKLSSGDHMRYWLYNEPIPKFNKMNIDEELKSYDKKAYNYQYECPVCNRKRTKKFDETETVPKTFRFDCPKCQTNKPFRRTKKEPTSVQGRKKTTKKYQELCELSELQKMDHLPQLGRYIPLKSNKGRGEKSATDKGALTRYITFLDKRLEVIEGLKRRLEKHDNEAKGLRHTKAVLLVLHEYSKYDKLKSTYWSFETRSNGKVYPSFLVTGTSTGRLSSKDPNFQNIPAKKAGKLIRGCFKADEGYELMSVDFSNLEVVIGGYVIQDKVLIDIVESGVNFHDVNTELFFGIKDNHPMWVAYRDATKIAEFACLFYGGTIRGTYTTIMTDNPDCGLTFKKFKQGIENYIDAHPDYKKWVDEVQDLAKTKRLSKNAFGRVRQLFGPTQGLGRQALNTPIQGSAADAVREDMVLLTDEFFKRNMKARTTMQIHDEFIFHYPKGERNQVVEVVKQCMNREREINGYKFRIGIDVEVGQYWGNTDKLDIKTMKVTKGSKH